MQGERFLLVAVVGVVRMPDLSLRMSATSKAATLGVAWASWLPPLYIRELRVTSRTLAARVFLLNGLSFAENEQASSDCPGR